MNEPKTAEPTTVGIAPEHVARLTGFATLERASLAELRAASAELALVREQRQRWVERELAGAFARDGLVLEGVDHVNGNWIAKVRAIAKPGAAAAATPAIELAEAAE
jgi:hypothetical protein